jgi:hypothetical protein
VYSSVPKYDSFLKDCQYSEKSKRAASALSKQRTTAVSNDIDVILIDFCVQWIHQQSDSCQDHDGYHQSESVYLVRSCAESQKQLISIFWIHPETVDQYYLDPPKDCPANLEFTERKM